jgi:hypothetical protein
LKGIIYHGGFHFNSRIIRPDKSIWFHDGITCGKNCINEGSLKEYISDDLLERNHYKACLIVYAKDI